MQRSWSSWRDHRNGRAGALRRTLSQRGQAAVTSAPGGGAARGSRNSTIPALHWHVHPAVADEAPATRGKQAPDACSPGRAVAVVVRDPVAARDEPRSSRVTPGRRSLRQGGAEAAGDAPAHNALIVDATRRHGGTVVKGQGDGFMLAFPSAHARWSAPDSSSSRAVLAFRSSKEQVTSRALPGVRPRVVRSSSEFTRG
jgi:hypothetical protein